MVYGNVAQIIRLTGGVQGFNGMLYSEPKFIYISWIGSFYPSWNRGWMEANGALLENI